MPVRFRLCLPLLLAAALLAMPAPAVAASPTVTALTSRSADIAYGAKAYVRGTLAGGGSALVGKTVALLYSRDGRTWRYTPRTASTDASGAFSFEVAPASRTFYRVRFAGDTTWLDSKSGAVCYTPRVLLGRPPAPASVFRNRAFTLTGLLAPRHEAGARSVQLRCYHSEDGEWVLRNTYYAVNYDQGASTRYTYANVRLGIEGSWRIVAYHDDEGHAATSASPVYVMVGPSTASYRGIGAWIDIYDSKPFDDPEGTMKDIAGRGAKTVFVETSNSGRTYAIHRPADMARLIRAAHSNKMKVVAWYLPTLRSPSLDYYRVAEAIRFRSSDGQRFDSFALDIESSAVTPVSERNRRLLELSNKTRSLVGPAYPLGAIIPSPAGMEKASGYWQPFPYTGLASVYDAFVPMGYYTYHGDGAALAYSDTVSNVRILRSQPGCAFVPIHMAGGLASRSSTDEVRAFVKACEDMRVQGASIYDWATMTDWHWTALQGFGP